MIQFCVGRADAATLRSISEPSWSLAAPCTNPTQAIELVLEMQSANTGLSSTDAFAADVEVVRRRLLGLGVAAMVTSNADVVQIRVDILPGADVDEVVSTLVQTALLEFIDPQGQYLPAGTFVTTTLGGTSEGTMIPTGPIYTTVISGLDLADTFPTTNSLGQLVIGFRLSKNGADNFFNFTSQHIGQPMSIAVDKQVISSPRIDAAISSEGIIPGVAGSEVNDLIIMLNAGPLAAPLRLVQSQTVQIYCPLQ